MATNWNPQNGFQSSDPDDPDEDNGTTARYGGTRESVTRSRHNRIGEGRSWRNYSELVGQSLGYDWRQYDFNDISPHSRNTERTRSGGQEESGQQQKDPLAREVDMTPPGSTIGKPTQTVVGTDLERREHPGFHIVGTEVQQQYPGELGNGPRKQLNGASSYSNGRGFGGQPLALGMPSESGPRKQAGMAQGGILRSRQNIGSPQQGNTAASMVGSPRQATQHDVYFSPGDDPYASSGKLYPSGTAPKEAGSMSMSADYYNKKYGKA